VVSVYNNKPQNQDSVLLLALKISPISCLCNNKILRYGENCLASMNDCVW